MNKKELTKGKIQLAFLVAIVADAFEFPIAWIETWHYDWAVIGGKFMGVMLDLAVMGILTAILGFNWVFFPSFCIEAISKIDMCPTWVGAVLFVAWKDKQAKEGMQADGSEGLSPVINVFKSKFVDTAQSAIRALNGPSQPRSSPSSLLTPQSVDIDIPAQLSSSMEPAFEQRLKRLSDLLNKKLISEAEYESKRGQILTEI